MLCENHGEKIKILFSLSSPIKMMLLNFPYLLPAKGDKLVWSVESSALFVFFLFS